MKKILYIKDNQDTREAVKILLSNAGYYIEISASGKEGIRLAEEKIFDLFLLDIMLPDMSGWDIFENLRKVHKNSKYVFLSAIPITFERMQELKKAGVSDYITKPFIKTELLDKLQKILEDNSQ